jgi:hypothetical protein
MIKKYFVPKKGLVLVFAVIIITGILFLLASPPFAAACIMLIIAGITITVLLRKEYTYSITIDSESRTIMFITKSRTSTVTDVCSFEEINFTYKKRIDYYSSTNGSLKEKRSILLIDSERKTLAYLVPNQDGWSNEVILDLAKTLAELSIKQIIEKYNDDEIPL